MHPHFSTILVVVTLVIIGIGVAKALWPKKSSRPTSGGTVNPPDVPYSGNGNKYL